MTPIFYVSPSDLPSRAANAVHVVHMCDAFSELGRDVILFARRTVERADDLMPVLRERYGVPLARVKAETFHGGARGANLRIAAMAVRRLSRTGARGVVISRNLYASWALSRLSGRGLLFETHQLETGFRKILQRQVMARPGVRTIVISDMLARLLAEHHGVAPASVHVLHDAAPDGMAPVPPPQRPAERERLLGIAPGRWRAVCGYFGHLYAGRGIEIIRAMAEERPDVLFMVFGGNEADVEAARRGSPPANLDFRGFVPHADAQRAMVAMDALLMPYQQSVSIGAAGHDTARWMSPMKMFEYLASGVPLVSSDLPVLREVLRDGDNALLAQAAVPDEWIAALDRLIGDPALGGRIGSQGRADFLAHHTWRQRAAAMLALAEAA